MDNDFFKGTSRAVGYQALIARYELQVIPNWHVSSISRGTTHRTSQSGTQVFEIFPRTFDPERTLAGDLEFALKYDGLNLEILAALFQKVKPAVLVTYIRSRPTGKFARRIWYLYELLTGRRLNLPDMTTGNYVDVLEPDSYYTAAPVRIRRQRVNDNLPGDSRFCPVIRRTGALKGYEQKDLPGKCRQLLEQFPLDILRRALGYLYTKETKSSFEIENVKIDESRVDRFVRLLVLAEQRDFFNESGLVELQNRIVDPRFAEKEYRTTQNYVAESVGLDSQRVHFISPKPDDLGGLMEGIYAAHARMKDSRLQPVAHAAAIAFGFVYMHPFEDGNGRIHRFLIHNILAMGGFTPSGVIFPVSAVMLNDRAAYEAALEAFSRPLLPLIEYALDDRGMLSVKNDTAIRYRYIDVTSQAEALFGFIDRVVSKDLAAELTYLQNYDATKSALQEIVDMPDRQLDLFIRLCMQNNFAMSKARRQSQFSQLSDDEVERMQAAVRRGFSDRVEAR